MTTIEKIKAEVERLKRQLVRGACAAQIEMETNCKEEAYDEVLSFISTLESEKPMNQEGLEEEINRTYHDGSVADTSDLDHNSYENIARHFYDIGCRRTAEKYDEIEYNRQRAEEKSMNPEGLDFQTFAKEMYPVFALPKERTVNTEENPLNWEYEIARHFAEWGAEHLADERKMSPNDLEEAAEDYAYNEGYQDPEYYNIVETFIAAAKWDREQMMKEAVECETVCIKDRLLAVLPMKEFRWTVGDKVRIIIVKDNN